MVRKQRAGVVVILVLVSAAMVAPAAGAPVDTASQLQDDARADGTTGQLRDVDEDEDESAEDDETAVQVLGDWWGLGGEATEAPYMGLVELGVVLLVVGVGGYSLGKRTDFVPRQYRRHLLQAHEWTVLAGTTLTVPHFLGVEEWEGLGVVVAVLLAVEVGSGLYGRHLHRRVIRLGRGDETPPLVGRVLTVTTRTLFTRWRRVHVGLTVFTGLVLLLHVVTAVPD